MPGAGLGSAPMREYAIPRVPTWRWTPFAALVLGSLSFAGFALLAIPDHFGRPEGGGSLPPLGFNNQPAGGQLDITPPASGSEDASSATEMPSAVTRIAARTNDVFPKRGFSPPLERPEPDAPAEAVLAPPAPPEAAPQPAAAPQSAVPAPLQLVLDPAALPANPPSAPTNATDPPR